jgi:tetratricopeptide (TPR) repeat protein/transcriptional regulator with XRE-family HTH domain
VFADVVRVHRRRLSLTQEELAELAGVSVRNIRKLEGGRVASPRPATVRLLADAFGLAGTERERFCRSAAGESTDQPARSGAPAQLPPDVLAFTGRDQQLRWLDGLLAGPGADPKAVVVSALSGTAGVGKTALAVHWSHQVRGWFPDGQLYANLRGYDPDQPVSPADVLARFLTALGVAGPEIPHELDERAARYRSELAGRRMLIVLDNAAAVAQVRPLLPGGSCLVVVTSRDSLAGLVAVDGARRLDLDLLTHDESITLLHRLIGPRVEAEPPAAATLADQCARLPLALRVAAERAAANPTTSLAELVVELRDHQRRLDLLGGGDDPYAAVTAVFSWSVRHLPADAARIFRLLGLPPGPDIDRHATAALAGTSLEHTDRTLALLTRAHLVHIAGAGRYGMHDLLRAYAAHLAAAQDGERQRRSALERMFDYYSAAAATAVDTLYPAEAHRRPKIPTPAPATPVLSDPDAARAWLDAERPALVAVTVHTAAHGWLQHTTRLSHILYRYLQGGGHYFEALAIHGHARRAGEASRDLAEQAHALRYLGATYVQLGQYGPATDHHHRALELFRQTGDHLGEALTLGSVGIVEQRLGRYSSAADYHRQALARFRHAGDLPGQAVALTGLGVVEQRQGRYRGAADYHQQALALFQKLGDAYGEAHALNGLGGAEARQERHASAAGYYQRALTLFRKLGSREGEAHALDSLGTVHIRLDQPEQASERLQEALGLFREIGDRDGEAFSLNGLGEAAHAAGRPAEALTHHAAALALAIETGARNQQARAHTGLGNAHHRLGRLGPARTHYQRAVSLYSDLDSPHAKEVRRHLAELG